MAVYDHVGTMAKACITANYFGPSQSTCIYYMIARLYYDLLIHL